MDNSHVDEELGIGSSTKAEAEKAIFFFNPLFEHFKQSKGPDLSEGETSQNYEPPKLDEDEIKDRNGIQEPTPLPIEFPVEEDEEIVVYDVLKERIPLKLDGGYGWIIVFASFMCNFIIDGMCNSFGIFLPEFVKEFKVGGGSAAWAGSLLCGTVMCVGPIVSALTNKYGCRPVCVAGAFVAATGFALSSLTNSLYALFLTYGIIGGVGFGLVYLPAVVCVAYYFESKRAFATGLSACGSGVGTFVFALLSHILLEKMSWQKTNLIFAAIILICGVFGLLFRPLAIQVGVDGDDQDNCPPTPQSIAKKFDSKFGSSKEDFFPIPMKKVSIAASTIIHEETTPAPTVPVEKSNEVSIEVPEESGIPDGRRRSSNRRRTLGSTSSGQGQATQVIAPLSRKDIFFHSSIGNLPEFQLRPSFQSYRRSILIKEESSDPNIIQNLSKEDVQVVTDVSPIIPPEPSKCPISHCGTGSFRSSLSQMVDCSLLHNPIFIFIAISNVFAMLGFYVPLVYISGAAMVKDVKSQDAAFLISIMGIANTIGRVTTGIISDLPRVNSLFVNNLSLLLSGICILCVPVCNHYYEFVIVSVLFGLFISAFASLSSIVLVELLGLDNLTSAFGLKLLFQGFAAIIGSPLAGIFYDTFGNYEIPFYLAGGFLLISSAISFLIPSVARFAPQEDPK